MQVEMHDLVWLSAIRPEEQLTGATQLWVGPSINKSFGQIYVQNFPLI